MADRKLLKLARAAAEGDAYAQVQLYRRKIAYGVYPPDTNRILRQALDVVCEGDGEPDEAMLEVLHLALQGHLTHGSWVKILKRGSDDELYPHGRGMFWWSVQYWYQGWGMRDCPDLRWMEHWTLCRAGLKRHAGRRRHQRWVSAGARKDDAIYSVREGLIFLANRLHSTYRPGVGPRIWQLERALRAAKAAVTKIKNRGKPGPAAFARLQQAKAEVKQIEDTIRRLEEGGDNDGERA